MKKKTGASKVNISMPKELFDYLKNLVEEHNAKPENAYCPTDFSKMVQKAIREMIERDIETEKGKVQSGVGAVIRPASVSSVFGRSTPTRKSSQKTG